MIEVLKIIKNYVENKKIKVHKINFDVLLSSHDSVFKDILEEKDDNKRISLIYLYSNKTFIDDSNKHKDDIIAFFKTAELTDYKAEYGSNVAVNENVLKREDAKEIIKLIVNAKETYQAWHGSYVAINENVLEREDAKEIIKLIVNAKEVYQSLGGQLCSGK